MSNILVVDDEMGVRESLHVFLTSEGHHIDTASNGREALNLIENKIYDLVLTDMAMPEMDGMTLLKEIKEKFKERTSVIIITADNNVQKAICAVKEGAVDFITKPFEINRLRTAVENALRHERKLLMAELQRREVETSHLKQLNHRLDRTVFELSILHEIGKTINSTLQINKIVSIILEMGRQTVNANRAALVLYQPQNREIKLQLTYCSNDAHENGELSLTDRRAIQWVTLNKQPLFLEDIRKSALFMQYLGDTEHIESIMAVPFKRKSQILGAIVLSTSKSQHHFLPEDLCFISTLANQAAIGIENAQLYEELQEYFADTIRALITAVEAKDTYTYGHSSRVTRYSLLMAEKLGIDFLEKRRLEYLSLLHDIGKIGIDEKILKKCNKLTDEEWEVIRNHSIIGGSIVKPIKFLPSGEKVIRHHHERFNGSGYPDGLKGEEIPLFSRIIAVADSFDAMTSLRPYRETWGAEEAIEELKRCSGEQFDPELVNVFINAYSNQTPLEE